MLPVLLDLTGRRVLVVGGGPVGRRRAAAARAAGAAVRVVCLEARPADAEGLDWLTAPYDAAHLDGVALALACGPAEVNARVAADARRRGVWVATASGPPGDATLPAVLRRGALVVAVATGGTAPALARAVRRKLEADFDGAFGEWAALLAELRPVVRRRVADAERRRALFERLCDWSWLARLRAEGVAAVRAALAAEVDAAAGR